MEISLVTLFRITAEFLIGFLLVRRFKNPLRALVVRMMPLKYRYSEKSFAHQTNISTLAAILIALAIASSIHLGLDRLIKGLDKEPTPLEPVKPGRSTLFPVGEDLSPSPQPEQKPAPEPQPQPVSTPTSGPEPEPVIIRPKPKPAPLVITEESFFLQVSAFEEEVYAWDHKESLEKRHSGKVWVAFGSADYIPYKVLVGPFPDRKSAMTYRRQKKLSGFARPLEELRLFAK